MRSLDSCRSAVPLIAVVLIGCSSGGGDSDRLDTYEVTGQITMNGSPVPNATVTFSPAEKQPVATARTDSQGNYTLTTYDSGDGAAAGEYVVLVSKSVSATSGGSPGGHDPNNPGAFTPPAHGAAKGRDAGASSTLPLKYSDRGQSDLNATVTPDGENVFNFDLEP